MRVVPFRPEHLTRLHLQPAQALAQANMTQRHGRELLSSPGEAWTAMLDETPIACAGVIEMWQGRGYAWAYLSVTALKHMRPIHRAVREFLNRAKWNRIELTADVNHVAASRWAVHLGFEYEGRLVAWTPDGTDVYQWARVKCKH